ncbi:MAG: YbhB/YbcL family Raf kinase inhibitor-like protein [Micromonosporaceae bacterium]
MKLLLGLFTTVILLGACGGQGGEAEPTPSPQAAAALALVVDDPDAVGGLYIHWVVTDIPPDSTGVTSGKPPSGARVTANSGGDASYLGPCPPAGTGAHHYRFTLYALPAALKLAADTPAKQAVTTIERQATTQTRLVGTYRG